MPDDSVPLHRPMTAQGVDGCYRRIGQVIRDTVGRESQVWADLLALIERENTLRNLVSRQAIDSILQMMYIEDPKQEKEDSCK